MAYRWISILLLITLTAGPAAYGYGADGGFHFQARLSSWGQMDDNGGRYRFGLRYLPTLTFEQTVGDHTRYGIETTLNALLSLDSESDDTTTEASFYRATAWLATSRTETVLGLQKINFGPATLLRPLQWFDSLDPTDPLGITRGVYGLRFRYFALNNANFWLWCLYPGNDRDSAAASGRRPTDDGTPQWGGRLQWPMLGGEVAVSANWRRLDKADTALVLPADMTEPPSVEERRLGLDGRWDLGVGLWFEMVWQQRIPLTLEWQKAMVGGLDYTFGWGNGLYLLVEQMAIAGSAAPLGWREAHWITASLLRYPLNVLDTVQLITSYDWTASGPAAHLSWQRTYDRLILDFALFYSPSKDPQPPGADGSPSLSGSGAMIMLIFNY